jgi:FkbM family methyltransferase
MRELLKRFLARSGLSLHRVPTGVVTGQDLARDLRLVVGKKESPLCIDVGANDGGTIDLLHRCLNSPQIYAFEPNPSIFENLQAKHGQSEGVRLIHAGLGDAKGKLTLQLFSNHTLNSFLPLSQNGRTRLDACDSPQTATVPVLRLDEFAAEEKLGPIELLKVDTQGFELHVLRGAEALFAHQRIRSVLIELNFADLYVGQATPADIITHLRSRGLHLVDFYEKCRHQPLLGWCTALFTQKDKPLIR